MYLNQEPRPADNLKKESKKQISNGKDILRLQHVNQNKTQSGTVKFRLYLSL